MTHAIRKGIGILRTQKTSLFLCDMQEKFKPNIKYFNEIVANLSRVLKAASVMEIPIIATEQYPKGLGPTVPELGLAEANIQAYPKTCFSMVLPQVMEDLKSKEIYFLSGIDLDEGCDYFKNEGRFGSFTQYLSLSFYNIIGLHLFHRKEGRC